jgi:hypothetical protein
LYACLKKTRFLFVLLVVALLSGCGGGSGGGAADSDSTRGSLSLRLNTSVIPQLNQTTSPDTITIDVLNPGSREPVHPRSTFQFSRDQTFQTFTVRNVIPGTHLVRLEIRDSSGALFFSGEQQAVLSPGAPTAVQFVIPPDGGGTDPGGDFLPSPTFRCVENADDEQGQPDVDVADDGYFFVVARVTDAATNPIGTRSFNEYGFIHGERFQTNFDGTQPTSIDAGNGNNGDFDISQFSTLEDVDGTNIFFDQRPVHPRISMNSDRAAVIAWLDSTPSPSAGGVPGGNIPRTAVVRSVILGPTSNTSNNSFLHREPEYSPNAEPNIAGPSGSLSRVSVSMTNQIGPEATIDYAFMDSVPQLPRFNDNGQSSTALTNGAPPVPLGTSPVNASFNTLLPLPLAVTNRKTDASSVIVAGAGTMMNNQVFAELTLPSATGTTVVSVNQGEPSSNGTDVTHVEADWFEGGTVVFVYTVRDVPTNGAGIYARCFDATLSTPIGNEIEIAPPANGVFHDLGDVAVVEADGTFLVTWTEFSGAGDARVLLQRFNCADGSRTPAAPIDVAAGQEPLTITNRNKFSRVASTSSGDAVVVWQTGESITDTVNVRAMGRVYPESSTD